ncbi:MAG TPA: hypothetical protein VJ813_04120 [Vicinamibacterales bacterium]|nr:hypothetical protein [Vicinamibacterales bacterium]
MAAMTSVLIRLYPRAWRERYGGEMRELLASQKLSLRTFTDLVAGAVDARMNPQQLPAALPGRMEGSTIMVRAFRCAPQGVTVRDQWRGAAWMAGGSIALTAFGILLKMKIGPNALSEGLMYAAFPAALMLSSECTYLRPYSPAARKVMSFGGAAFVVVIIWIAVLIGDRI